MLVLTRSDTLELASLPDCIDAVAGAFRAYGEGRSLGAGRLHLHGLGGGAFHLTAGGIAFDGARGVVGAKLNGRFPPLDGETGQRLAGRSSSPMLATGMPAALLDSAVVTGLRTAAVTAVVAGTLARPDAESALLVGAGRQGRWQVDALAATGRIRRSASPISTARVPSVLPATRRSRGCRPGRSTTYGPWPGGATSSSRSRRRGRRSSVRPTSVREPW